MKIGVINIKSMKGSLNLGNQMLKMMTGFDSSIKPTGTSGPDGQDHQSLHSRARNNQTLNTLRKDADHENNETFAKQKETMKQNQDRDKMTVSVKREGERNQIVVILESQDQDMALQMQIDEIRVKAENQNYNWEIFDIKQELGQGTFGQVFACLDQKTGKKFALKFIGYEMESDQDPDFKSAVKEIVIMQTLARSNHNSILRIHDVYPCIKDDNKYLVIVMELCDCNLMELIKVRIEENRSRWTDEELFYILDQLVDAFLTMKSHHITHRDIKPQNILYSYTDKNYKVADLGGAKFLNPVKKVEKKMKVNRTQRIIGNDDPLNTVRGSPAYWSPEIYYQCDLQKDKDGRFFVGKQHLPYDPYISDVYSVGITFLLMKKLLPRMDREQIKVEVENFKRLKNPTPFDLILIKMLEHDEKERLSFEEVNTLIKKDIAFAKQPNEDVYVNCLKTGKDKKNMNPQDLMQREINLADAYEKLFMLTHAKNHYDLALKQSQKLSKENPRADILNSLGTVNCDLNALDEAEKNYLESAQLYKKLYGDKHTSVADAYNNIGIVKRKKCDYKGAIKYYEQAYAIKEQVFGENNLGGALILSNIGLAYRKLGNLDQAIKYYKNALQIKKLICGDRSLILCGTYDNLARVYFLRQQYELAISCYQITAEIYRRYIGSNQIRLADSLFELGLCYQNIGRYSDASKCFEEAYSIRKEQSGPMVKATIMSQEHLAQCQLEEGKFEQAIEQYEQLKHVYNKGLYKCSMDERIDSIIDVLKNLGAGYMGMANYQSSLGSYEEAILQLQKRQSDKKVMENTRLAKILYNMGLVYRKMGNIEKAKLYYNHAATQIAGCTTQTDMILLGDIYNNMGVLYGMTEQFQQGKTYFQQALDKYQQIFGKGHHLCKEVETNLQEIDKWIEQSPPKQQ